MRQFIVYESRHAVMKSLGFISLAISIIEAIFLLFTHSFNQGYRLFIPPYNLHHTIFYASLILALIWGLYFFISKRKWRVLCVFLMAYSAIWVLIGFTIMVAGEDYLLGAPYSVAEIETEQYGRLMLSRDDHRSGVTYQLWRKEERHFSQMIWEPLFVQPSPALNFQFAGRETLTLKGDLLMIKRQSIWIECYNLRHKIKVVCL